MALDRHQFRHPCYLPRQSNSSGSFSCGSCSPVTSWKRSPQQLRLTTGTYYGMRWWAPMAVSEWAPVAGPHHEHLQVHPGRHVTFHVDQRSEVDSRALLSLQCTDLCLPAAIAVHIHNIGLTEVVLTPATCTTTSGANTISVWSDR